MREYDQMIAQFTEQAGVRMASGHHIDSPIPRHTAPLPEGWVECECGVRYDPTIVKWHRCAVWHDTDSWVDRRDNDR